MKRTPNLKLVAPGEGDCLAVADQVIAARREHGDRTVYAKFLCQYIGSGEEGSRAFRPITQIDSRGKQHDYNDPNWHLTGFTPDGYLIDARWSQDYDPSTDPESARLFVATANLRQDDPGAIREWRVSQTWQRMGRLTVLLESDNPPNPAYRPFAFIQSRPGAYANREWCQIAFNSESGIQFYPPGGGEAQRVLPVGVLIAQVNQLTEQSHIRLGDELLVLAA